eukprot:TRINITY_DN5528_c0_g1_i2.p1 TRINITY_DN5528_c0_g1~~TRINITY_DN5528_c0_g1_i2.p1  ORF type:complete len:262 (+),score=32.69 TRINITY_DN5528_c0_g1_i2:322-1107(+)
MQKHFKEVSDKSPGEEYLNIVMDYYPETLHRIIKYYRKVKQQMPLSLIKIFTYQLLRGLAFVHGKGIVHRDIKPQNLLIDPRTNTLVIADFGSAKRINRNEESIAYICSRYYRAPELFLGCTRYSDSIDIWSVGCVVAEMLIGTPLFSGETITDQLVEIIRILGVPTPEELKICNPLYEDFKFPNVSALGLKKVFDDSIDQSAIEFLSSILIWNHHKRPKALDLLGNKFFDELRDKNFSLGPATSSRTVPDFFDFTSGIAL